MNILLFFFALPVAIIILSAIFETFVRCPIKIAGITFAILLIVAFALGGTTELIVATIIYTIISFITAYVVCLMRSREINNCCNNSNFINSNSVLESTGNIVAENNFNNVLTESITNNSNNNCFEHNLCSCRRYR